MTAENTDPRPLYRSALSWVQGLIAAVRPDQLADPTPCPDFDVRALLGHLVVTVEKPRVLAEGGDVHAVAQVVTGVADDGWAAAYGAMTDKLWAIWADDALLTRPLTAPWGEVPGAALLMGYLNETLVHGWDLAVATGQDCEADPLVATAALATAKAYIPAEIRALDDVPFDAPVEPAPEAGPTERLANWSGHARPRP